MNLNKQIIYMKACNLEICGIVENSVIKLNKIYNGTNINIWKNNESVNAGEMVSSPTYVV